MANEKARLTAGEKSTSTHFRNNETMAPADDGAQAVNNQDAQRLIEPGEEPSGSTHFNNNETFNEKTNRQNGGQTTAGAKKKTLATDHKPVPLSPVSKKKHPGKELHTKAATEEVDVQESKEPGQQDTQHFENDIDPTDGYLETEVQAEIEDMDGEPEVDEVAVEETDPNGMGDEQAIVEPEDVDDEAEDDWDTDEVDAGDEINPAGLLDGDAPQQQLEYNDEPNEVNSEEVDFEADPEFDEEVIPEGGEEVPMLDIDETDDGETDDVMFASIGTQLKVIKANRIIASMGKKVAAKAGYADVYLSDEFQEATAVEMSKHGLRAGLRKQGFVFATVNVARKDVLNKRVEARAQKLTASVRATAAAESKALEQCLAIAAVGIDRQYFSKDFTNPLKAGLVEELDAIGVRGSRTLANRVFAAHSIAFTKTVLTLAQKLAAMSEDARNQFAAALDMTNDEAVDIDGLEDDAPEQADGDLFGDSASPDFQSHVTSGEEFDDNMEHEMESPRTISAALSRPASRVQSRQALTASQRGVSLTASNLLDSDKPIQFML